MENRILSSFRVALGGPRGLLITRRDRLLGVLSNSEQLQTRSVMGPTDGEGELGERGGERGVGGRGSLKCRGRS